jgi:solute carrier family 25 oxoglutarate transporter 11
MCCLPSALAAAISCPAEVTLVRISNDAQLAPEKRRNYKGVVDAFQRILREEGVKTFFSGCGPFVNRAMMVGAVQVGTYDQFREMYKDMGVKHELLNVFYASMTSGLIYAIATMPFETAKNRMAFQVRILLLHPTSSSHVIFLPPVQQKPDPVTKVLPYRSAMQTITTIAKTEGVLTLWNGFPPYYIRCGGHTVLMFMSVAWLRKQYQKMQEA